MNRTSSTLVVFFLAAGFFGVAYVRGWLGPAAEPPMTRIFCFAFILYP